MSAATPAGDGNGGGNGKAPVLLVDDIHTFYGSIEALKGISIEVNEGEIVTLIGANGAGKSTTLRSISGIVPPRTGRILFNGREIQGLPGHTVAEIGIAQSPEGRRIFPRMTVLENLEMGAFTRRDPAGIREDLDRVYTLFPRLKERERQKGGTMSGGEQQMLAIGRALMAQPTLLLLDEPSMGIAPILVERIYETIAEINKQGTTILLVEQNANFALDVSKRAYVLETGKVTLSDQSAALRENPEVQRAYLGA
jgi:branched-chain amino acid transport system ATP-binding protein